MPPTQPCLSVIDNLHAQLEYIARAKSTWKRLLSSVGQSLIVDERPVGALRVTYEKLSLLWAVPHYGMVAAEHLAVEYGIVGGGLDACNCSTDLRSLFLSQGDVNSPLLEGVGVGAGRQNGYGTGYLLCVTHLGTGYHRLSIISGSHIM